MNEYISATITHSQITVFQSDVAEFNEWDNDHVAQGFSWRPGNVSFGLPDTDNDSLVQISDQPLQQNHTTNDIERVIEVPFKIVSGVVVGTTYDDYEFDIPAGLYQLKFTVIRGYTHEDKFYDAFVIFEFTITKEPVFRILTKGGEMTSERVLKTTAKTTR